MTTTQIISSNSYQQMLWKNGGGVTQEICRYPKEETFHWRLSMAMVNQDGAFSFFEGYQRIISILNGEGIYLLQDKKEKKLIKEQDVFTFSGDQAIHCQLVNGSVTDFNLIFDPTHYQAGVQWVQPQAALNITTSAKNVLLFSNECSSKVLVNNYIEKDLLENDTLWITQTNDTILTEISLTISAPVILIELWQIKD